MSKRQASIATFLSPRHSSSTTPKRAPAPTRLDQHAAKRPRTTRGDDASGMKRKDSSDVEIIDPTTSAQPGTQLGGKGKSKANLTAGAIDVEAYNGAMNPEEAERQALAESVRDFGSSKARDEASGKAASEAAGSAEMAVRDPSTAVAADMSLSAASSSSTALSFSQKTSNPGSSTTPSSQPFNYPPPTHASYRLPPSPTYNHPITIMPPPSPLIDALRFNTTPRIIKSPAELDLLYFTKFIDPTCSRQLTKYLLEAMPWYRVNYTTKGIDIKTPRYTTVFGKDSTPMPWEVYDKWKPRAIPEILLRLMQKVEEVTGETYNFTLVNYYSSGTDSISYHSDSERFLGPNPCIASISLGAPRDFMLRHVDYRTNGIPVQKFNLHDGDMVVMRGKTQHKYQHAIPKRAKAEGRINITFRKGVVQYATENYLTYNVGRGPMFRWIGGKMVQQGVA